MKKTFIIFSFLLCTAFLNSCNKDQDKTSTNGTENPSNTNGPAEDPAYSGDQTKNGTGNGSSTPEDHTSTAPGGSQTADPYTENQTTTSARDGNTLNQNNNGTPGKDSLTGTGAAGQQGAGSGVGNGGSINGAQDNKKK